MKKKLLFVGVAFMALSTMQAQDGVGIGKSIIPDGSAVLDIGATDKGVLFPRVALKGEADVSVISGGKAANGLLVYNTATVAGTVIKPGFYFWDGTVWNALMSKASTVLSETLTKLEIGKDANDEVILKYTDENGKVPNVVEISTELQGNTKFQEWIASRVNLVDLKGDVTGTAQNTKVVSIQGVKVSDVEPTEKGSTLVYNDANKTWEPGMMSVDGSKVTPTEALKEADGISIVGGDKSMLKEVTIGLTDNSIKPIKISAEDKASQVLVTSTDGKKVEWVAQNTIKPDGSKLSGDASIEVTDGDLALVNPASIKVKDLGIKEGHLDDGAVTTTKIKDGSITNKQVADNTLTVEKLAKVDTNKDKRLVTDNAGQPVWESKYTTISSTPVATNEVMDGKKVYTVKFDNVVVKEGQPGVGYNTGIESLPKIDKYDYLLRAEVYTDKNKLVVSSVTDVEDANGVIKFRFGMNKMYSTLPAATNYKVVLKYVSTEAAVTP